jgi:hypothetical protein
MPRHMLDTNTCYYIMKPLGLTLVTNNSREFKRVRNLTVENCLAGA